MTFFTRLSVPSGHAGLLLQDGVIRGLLPEGSRLRFDPARRLSVQLLPFRDGLIDLPEPLLQSLAEAHSGLLGDQFQILRQPAGSLGLIRRDQRLVAVLRPAQTALIWRGRSRITVDSVPFAGPAPIPADLFTEIRLSLAPEQRARSLSEFIVAAGSVGVLLADGVPLALLQPGSHGWWSGPASLGLKSFPTGAVELEIGGQELLTRDRITLRVTMIIRYKVEDPLAAVGIQPLPERQLYVEGQLALRAAVATQDLGDLLGRRDALSAELQTALAPALAQLPGISLHAVGVKDIILPGEMRVLMAKVIEAQKAAEADVIRRQQEVAATRSQLNTARLMDQHPTLMRLKEMELLARVADHVQAMTVMGGLDGFLDQFLRARALPRPAEESGAAGADAGD